MLMSSSIPTKPQILYPRKLPITIRQYEPTDADGIAQLFHSTVRTINRQDYSQAQVEAWAPDDIHFRDWSSALLQSSNNGKTAINKHTFVAECDQNNHPQKGVLVGFAELESNGHIDCFYCHKEYQRQGIGRQLLQAMETKAVDWKLDRISAEASITARPFFEAMGFCMIEEQVVSCRGQSFVNFKMVKELP